ncbi:MAG TPA: flavin reductase family protein [Gemmatimonadaceae bacterium]|nr:flavin reductase family protein [Gemmatimonadaceae bacterium]
MNREALREVLRSLVHGVYVLGTGRGAEAHLATVSWVTQVSAEPPMVAVALHRESRVADRTTASLGFTLSPLAHGHTTLASRLGRPAAPASKLTGIALETSPSLGLPLPTESTGWLECRVAARMDAGDHVLVLGAVVDAGTRSTEATLLLRETGWRY